MARKKKKRTRNRKRTGLPVNGDEIRNRRLRKNLSQKQFAEALDKANLPVGYHTIQRMEASTRDKKQYVIFDKIENVATFFNVDPDMLLFDTTSGNTNKPSVQPQTNMPEPGVVLDPLEVARLCNHNGWTPQVLAEKAAVGVEVAWNAYNGKSLTFQQADAIARAFGKLYPQLLLIPPGATLTPKGDDATKTRVRATIIVGVSADEANELQKAKGGQKWWLAYNIRHILEHGVTQITLEPSNSIAISGLITKEDAQRLLAAFQGGELRFEGVNDIRITPIKILRILYHTFVGFLLVLLAESLMKYIPNVLTPVFDAIGFLFGPLVGTGAALALALFGLLYHTRVYAKWILWELRRTD